MQTHEQNRNPKHWCLFIYFFLPCASKRLTDIFRLTSARDSI